MTLELTLVSDSVQADDSAPKAPKRGLPPVGKCAEPNRGAPARQPRKPCARRIRQVNFRQCRATAKSPPPSEKKKGRAEAARDAFSRSRVAATPRMPVPAGSVERGLHNTRGSRRLGLQRPT
jgi:hypothetical protein